jgi:hypothetical protein
MRSFELNIFIDRPREEVYEHVSQPINIIGLQPLLTTIDVLKEQKDGNGVIIRPYHTVLTFRWLKLPILRKKIYAAIHVTKPPSELEFHVFSKPDVNIVYHYLFNETEEGGTHLIQKVSFERVNKLLESLVFDQAIQAQRALLANLKVRLEKN